jgi:hypothetical protein
MVYLGQNTLFTASPVEDAADYRFNIYPPQGSVPWYTQENGGPLPNVNMDTSLFAQRRL